MTERLKPYSEYKETGLPWLGRIPAHWKVRRLKSEVENVVQQTSEMASSEIYVALEHVEGWTGRFRPQKGAELFEGQVKHFEAGDVLFGKLRPYLAKVTTMNAAGVCAGEFFVLRRRNGNLLPAFLEQELRTKTVIDTINSSTFGAKMPRADWQFIGNLRLAFPPFTEQAAIVRFLDHVNRQIERSIYTKRKLIELLNEQKQTIIDCVIGHGLDPGVRLKPSGVAGLGNLPEHWEVVPLKRRVGFQEGPGIMGADFRDEGVPLLRISCLRGDEATLVGCNFLDPDMVRRRWAHFAVQSGDYLLSASASTGSVTLATEVVGGAIPYTGILRLWAVSDHTYMPYVRLFMACRHFQDQIQVAKSGVAIEHFGPTHLKRMFISLPPFVEQQSIVDWVNDHTASFASLVGSAKREIDLLREYRARLIADIVTGQLDVQEAAGRLPDEIREPESTYAFSEDVEGNEAADEPLEADA